MPVDAAPPLPVFPGRLGVAADLVFIASSPADYLLNALLVYEQIVLPIDAMVLGRLTADFSVSQLKRLAGSGRIAFCPQATAHLAIRKEPEPYSRGTFLARLGQEVWYPEGSTSALVGFVDSHLIDGNYGDYSAWQTIRREAEQEFMHAAARPGYEFLLPPTDLFSNRLDRFTGLTTGLGRMNDLIVAGVADMQHDKELPVLLEICFPAQRGGAAVPAGTVERDALAVVDRLHSLKGLPVLSPGNDRQEIDRCLDIVLSDEADELRHWIRNNLASGIDIRDAYAASEARLPSKKAWTGWLKFGVVTGVSTAVGALIADPVTGFAVGTGISAVDQQYGQKSIEKLFDPYHPARWLSYVEKHGGR